MVDLCGVFGKAVGEAWVQANCRVQQEQPMIVPRQVRHRRRTSASAWQSVRNGPSRRSL